MEMFPQKVLKAYKKAEYKYRRNLEHFQASRTNSEAYSFTMKAQRSVAELCENGVTK